MAEFNLNERVSMKICFQILFPPYKCGQNFNSKMYFTKTANCKHKLSSINNNKHLLSDYKTKQDNRQFHVIYTFTVGDHLNSLSPLFLCLPLFRSSFNYDNWTLGTQQGIIIKFVEYWFWFGAMSWSFKIFKVLIWKAECKSIVSFLNGFNFCNKKSLLSLLSQVPPSPKLPPPAPPSPWAWWSTSHPWLFSNYFKNDAHLLQTGVINPKWTWWPGGWIT